MDELLLIPEHDRLELPDSELQRAFCVTGTLPPVSNAEFGMGPMRSCSHVLAVNAHTAVGGGGDAGLGTPSPSMV